MVAIVTSRTSFIRLNSILQSKKSRYIKRIFVSTDSNKIAKEAIKNNAEVPFIRPEYLANDETSTIDVIIHAVNYFQEMSIVFDYLILLEPTSPLRDTQDIDRAIEMLHEKREKADSIVFNPHKWLGAQFDCSAHFVADPTSLVKTLAIQPEYLKTHGRDGLINYSEWSVPLGRRFRALKLWFLLRSYGLEDLRLRMRNHVSWAEDLAKKLEDNPQFEVVTAPILSLFTFRLTEFDDAAQIDFVNRINDDGQIYITQTKVDGKIAIRFQIGQFDVTEADIQFAYKVICEMLNKL